MVCVGSALTSTNFHIFSRASCALSVLVGGVPLCATCKGRDEMFMSNETVDAEVAEPVVGRSS